MDEGTGPGPQILGPGMMQPPQQSQQLPPQMFTTAAQLLDLTDSEDIFSFYSFPRWLDIQHTWEGGEFEDAGKVNEWQS